jgi:hypothetical protein
MGRPASKAAGFTTTTHTIREMASADAWERLLAALPEDTRALVHKPPLAVAWLDVHHFGALIDTALRVVFAGDEGALVVVGRRSIGKDLNTLYKMFIRLATPSFVIQRATKLWAQYNQEHGHMAAASLDMHSARITYSNIVIGSPAFWAYQRGAILAAVDATGIKNARIELAAGGGVDSATFEARWED